MKSAAALVWCGLPDARCAGEVPGATRPPNVIVILVDDMGWRDLGCQGSEFFQTPRIDRLAASGVRFTQGYAACKG